MSHPRVHPHFILLFPGDAPAPSSLSPRCCGPSPLQHPPGCTLCPFCLRFSFPLLYILSCPCCDSLVLQRYQRMEKNLTKHQVVLLCTFSIVTHKSDQITPLSLSHSLPPRQACLTPHFTPGLLLLCFLCHSLSSPCSMAELRDAKFSLADLSHTMKSKGKH